MKPANNSVLGRRSLLEHQDKAVRKIISVLGGHDRTKYIAACGSGKTLVGLHSVKALNARDVVVFLPSLALVRQTLIEWTSERMLDGHAIMCVCSDNGVAAGLDELVVTEEDIGLPITTDALSIRRFFTKNRLRPKLALCTYQSAGLLADGLLKNFWFDFGVFDEAHKTAGKDDKKFAAALEDNHIRIRKRLFLTATPRYCRVRKANEDESVPVYSMDSEDDYGPEADRLSFSEAISRKLICDYRVIVSVVTSQDIDRRFLRQGNKLSANGRQIDLMRAVHMIAMQKAVSEFGIKKVFTFHGTVDDAKQFVHGTDQPFQEYLPGFEALHINGSMPARERSGIMDLFNVADKAVLSNARCLTEGVDVPAADMVAFLCPKRSLIDIVQAVGRALRVYSGKQFGYVLLPVFVDQKANESVEEACARTRYDFAWEVIQAMKMNDATLSDEITAAAVRKGQSRNSGAVELSKKIEIVGASTYLQAIKQGISAVCVEAVGESFDVWFGRLLAYKERYGHCLVPTNYTIDGVRLGAKVCNWRAFKIRLTPTQREMLDSIGFVWSARTAAMEGNFALLAQFQKDHGHCLVPKKYMVGGVNLYELVKSFRCGKRHVTPKLRARLDAIGFVWNVPDYMWQRNFESLAAFKQKHGHCLVPKDYVDDDGRRLGQWVGSQRCAIDHRSIAQRKRLDSLGFVWDVSSHAWEKMFGLLAAFKNQHGHCDVPLEFKTMGASLGQWIRSLRTGNTQITSEQRKRLIAVGFNFDGYLSKEWNKKFDLLVAYKTRYGHTNIPSNYEINGVKLGYWVGGLRTGNVSLSSDRKDRLNAIGFVWNPKNSKLERIFALLEAFQKEHGHCTIPVNYRIDGINLGQCARSLREGSARSVKIKDRLNAIGFDWNPRENKFKRHFELLTCFHKEHGHCLVPVNYVIHGVRLGRLVRNLRTGRTRLSTEQKKMLDNIGFTWGRRR